jgi:hypothetical protein
MLFCALGTVLYSDLLCILHESLALVISGAAQAPAVAAPANTSRTAQSAHSAAHAPDSGPHTAAAPAIPATAHTFPQRVPAPAMVASAAAAPVVVQPVHM